MVNGVPTGKIMKNSSSNTHTAIVEGAMTCKHKRIRQSSTHMVNQGKCIFEDPAAFAEWEWLGWIQHS